MRTRKWAVMTAMLGTALVLHSVTPATADIASDRAAAILVFPKIVTDTSEGTDTLIQITNTSNDPALLHCFYINANNHCTISGTVCDLDAGIGRRCPLAGDVCLPSWVETDFRVLLTMQQPIAWTASEGLANGDVPIDGFFRVSPSGQTNVGTRVPPVPAEALSTETDPDLSFTGELKCIVVDGQERAIPSNVVKGEATIVTRQGEILLDAEKYNAVGIQAIEGDSNGDNILELGGDSNEYNGCASVLIVDHFFDYAINPVTSTPVFSDLTLVPCNEDLLNQVPGGGTAQYLVYNEFEQRFSTSTPIQCFYETQMSRIDTRNTTRSIFSAFVAGTLTGQTRIRGVNTGFIGLLRERTGADFRDEIPRYMGRSAAVNVDMQGERPVSDQIVLP